MVNKYVELLNHIVRNAFFIVKINNISTRVLYCKLPPLLVMRAVNQRCNIVFVMSLVSVDKSVIMKPNTALDFKKSGRIHLLIFRYP